jgi:hypothetical protein
MKQKGCLLLFTIFAVFAVVMLLPAVAGVRANNTPAVVGVRANNTRRNIYLISPDAIYQKYGCRVNDVGSLRYYCVK